MKDHMLAFKIKEAYIELSPLIEEYTAHVCPDCKKVCCIDRHGTHEPADMELLGRLKSAGVENTCPPEPPKPDDKMPCRHLLSNGCSLERWRRPYRCTWYFCTPILKHMQSAHARQYRKAISGLELLGSLREELISEMSA
jgi:hypothetical protein